MFAELQNVNLREAGTYIPVAFDMLADEAKSNLEALGYDTGYDGLGDVWAPDLERLAVGVTDYAAVLWEASFWDDDQFQWAMEHLLKPANHYLVFASGCRWNGASGYRFADNFLQCVSRDYDSTIIPQKQSKGKKVLTCLESSHDVPTGGTTHIIALTDTEYARLQDASFEKVEAFVKRTVK